MGCLKFCEDKYFLFVGSETKVILKCMCIMQTGSQLFCYNQLPTISAPQIFLFLVVSVSAACDQLNNL